MATQALLDAAIARVEAATRTRGLMAFAAAAACELDAHVAYPEVQVHLLHALTRFAAEGTIAPSALRPELEVGQAQRIAEASLRALRAHAALHGTVVEAVFAALEALAPALSAQSAGAAIREAVDALLGNGDFAAHASDGAVVSWACLALSSLALQGERNTRLALDAGAASALVAAMRRCPSCRVQSAACETLYWLFRSSFSDSELQAEAHHAVDAAVAALCAFPDNENVVASAAFAIAAILRDNLAALQTPALLTCVVDALPAALRRHGACVLVAEAVCRALASLDFHLPGVTLSAAETVLDAVLAVVRLHAEDAGAHEHGLDALANACRGPTHAAAHAAAAGAIEAAVSAMRRHRENPCVQTYGCMLLVGLFKHGPAGGTTLARAGVLGAVTVVVDVLRAGGIHRGDAARWEHRLALCVQKCGGHSPERWAAVRGAAPPAV
jgi:hypothetical protein